MKKQLLALIIMACLSISSYAQPTNIYQPNGSTTNFGKVTSDSLNYYVVNYPALTLIKIDGSNNSTLVTTLTADPFQTMIWNNGKGIYPVANGSPFKLFDGTNQIDISGGQLPMAGYTLGNAILLDYFHKGNTTYFRTNDKIYKTDYSSPSSIITLATRQSTTGVGILDMSHTSNSIIYQDIVSQTGVLKRLDLRNGNVSTLDSSNAQLSSYDKGIVYNNEYYYCTPPALPSWGTSKIFKVSDGGVKSILYTETDPNQYIIKVIGGTPNGIIAVIQNSSKRLEYISINAGVATSINFGTSTDPYPTSDYGGGVTTNSLVYFSARDTSSSVSGNKALWVTDGTLTGTKKIKGGTSSRFNLSGLGQDYLGTFASCGDDIYYEGRDGALDGLIHVDGTTFAMKSYTDLPNPVTIRQTASGILAILRTSNSSATKAVYKVNCSSVTSIKETLSNQISFDVFPNPAKDQITVSLSGKSKNHNLKIYNLLGENVYSQSLKEQSSSINLNLKSGLYFADVQDEYGNKATRKIIVQ